MDEAAATSRAITAALKERGFHRKWGENGLVYRGSIKCAGKIIPVSIDVVDTEFVTFPIITISPEAMPSRKLPHLIRNTGSICYLEKGVAVLNRYTPDGTVLWCLDKAQETLEHALSGKSKPDFAAEFFAYWGDTSAYIDLLPGFTGEAVVYAPIMEATSGKGTIVIGPKGGLMAAIQRLHKDLAGNVQIQTRACLVADIPADLTVTDGISWPPEDLATLLQWLKPLAPDFQKKLMAHVIDTNESLWCVVLRARNGDFVVEFSLPSQLNKNEFTKTRRGRLPDHLLASASKIKVTRSAGRPIDRDHIYGRNLSGMKSLMDKKILVIGCGTIGGFLAQQLAQSGAGAGADGRLSLVDDDHLGPQNLGRHLLGLPYLRHNKAAACVDFLSKWLPHLTLEAIDRDALTLLKQPSQYDLIIDVTGEEGLSTALNHRAIHSNPAWPPILHVWLVGNGAAAQALFADRSGGACFKCLKPEWNGQPRYDVLRKETVLVPGNACGDSTYVPFPVSRSVQAASLALEMTLAWVNGDLRHKLQTRVFDHDLANARKDTNPEKSAICPACNSHQ